MSQKFKLDRKKTTLSGIWLALEISGHAILIALEILISKFTNNWSKVALVFTTLIKQGKSFLPDETIAWADKVSKSIGDKKNAKEEADKILSSQKTWCEANDKTCTSELKDRNCVKCDKIEDVMDSIKNAAFYVNVDRKVNIENININIINSEVNDAKILKDVLHKIKSINRIGPEDVEDLNLIMNEIKEMLADITAYKK